MANAVVKRLNDCLLEVLPARMRLDYRISLGVAQAFMMQARHISFDASGYQSYQRMHVFRDAAQRPGVKHPA